MGVGLPLILILAVVTGAGFAVTVLAILGSRRQIHDAAPRCGKCGYNLTGAVSNRCPECGGLFIDVGVVRRPASRLLSRRVTWSLLLVLIVVALLGAAGVAAVARHAHALRAARRARAAWPRAGLPLTTQGAFPPAEEPARQPH